MTAQEIHQLQQTLDPLSAPIETHISWILFRDREAFKIKKPVALGFLDFSTLNRRRFFCARELELNRRFSPEVYLDLIPVQRLATGQLCLGGTAGQTIDYAVHMRRLEQHNQMDERLHQRSVSPGDMQALADVLARFHQQAPILSTGPGAVQLEADFRDLEQVFPTLHQLLGPESHDLAIESLDHAAKLILRLQPRIEWRISHGFVRDGHGDLHCRNIFLGNTPILFDCLEFSDALRQADLLCEIAFLGADLHAFGRDDLWQAFLQAYQAALPVLFTPEDHALLRWFLWYRAGVRLKVTAIQSAQHPHSDQKALKAAWRNYGHFTRLNAQKTP